MNRRIVFLPARKPFLGGRLRQALVAIHICKEKGLVLVKRMYSKTYFPPRKYVPSSNSVMAIFKKPALGEKLYSLVDIFE